MTALRPYFQLFPEKLHHFLNAMFTDLASCKSKMFIIRIVQKGYSRSSDASEPWAIPSSFSSHAGVVV